MFRLRSDRAQRLRHGPHPQTYQLVVDHLICSESQNKVHILPGGCADNPGSFPFGELNSVVTYASRRPVNKHSLAGGKICRLKQRLPSGQSRERTPPAWIKSIDLGFSATSDSGTAIYSAYAPLRESAGGE